MGDTRVEISKMGVYLGYHKTEEYNKPSLDQKRELTLWHVKNQLAVEEQKKKKTKKVKINGGKTEKTVTVAAVNTTFSHEKKKQSEETISREGTKRFTMSFFSPMITRQPQSL